MTPPCMMWKQRPCATSQPLSEGVMEPMERQVTRVMIVEESAPVRAVLKGLLEQSGKYQVVGAYMPGDGLLAGLNGGADAQLALVGMPLNPSVGLASVALLRAERPAMGLLVYNWVVNQGMTVRTYRAGAETLCSPRCSLLELLRALDTMALGIPVDER